MKVSKRLKDGVDGPKVQNIKNNVEDKKNCYQKIVSSYKQLFSINPFICDFSNVEMEGSFGAKRITSIFETVYFLK